MTTTASQLALIETAIETRLSGGAVESYSIGNRNLRYSSLEDLMKLKAQYLAIQAGENPTTNLLDFQSPI